MMKRKVNLKASMARARPVRGDAGLTRPIRGEKVRVRLQSGLVTEPVRLRGRLGRSLAER
jgi:hypothetical protein